MLCGLADGLDALIAQGFEVDRIVLIGGGARSAAIRGIAPAVFGRPVVVPPPGEYVADGAARQAAWMLEVAEGSGTRNDLDQPPSWKLGDILTYESDEAPWVREQYAAVRDLLPG